MIFFLLYQFGVRGGISCASDLRDFLEIVTKIIEKRGMGGLHISGFF